MKLHYASDTPEWSSRPAAARNVWQRLARKTHGVVTLGNLLSIVGIILVLIGFWRLADHRYWTGFWLVAVGRFCDILDGTIANATGTKSPLGEAVDVVVDKIAAVTAIVALLVSHIAPWWLIALIAIQNLTTVYVSLRAKKNSHQLHTIAAGKFGSIAEWGGFISFILAAALERSTTTSHVWLAIAYTSSFVGISLNGYAVQQYARNARKKL